MTNKQLVDEILSIKAVDTKSNLMKKSKSELEAILSQLEDEMIKESQTAQITSPSQPQVDVEALKAQMMAELKDQVRKELESEQVQSAPTVKSSTDVQSQPVSKRADVDRFEMIPIMNATNGSLIYASRKTGAEWNWSEYGDIEYMEFQELLSMRSAQRRFFDEPFILVMHDEAVEQLGLTKMYSNIQHPDQIDNVFKLNQKEFEDVLEKSPRGIKLLIISRAKVLYDSGELDSIKKINFINESFSTDIGQRG